MATKKTEDKSDLLPGGITQAQADAWKKEHGEVDVITVKVSDTDTAVGYFRPLKREEYGVGAQVGQKKGPYAVGNYIVNQCWLGGDKRIQQDDKVYASASTAAMELYDFFEASTSKL